jgi:c-di-GMP-binding flagellar brake protein YcgR
VARQLELNRKVAVQRVAVDDKEFYSSYIAGIDDDTLSLAAPMYHGELVPFKPGEQIRVYTWPIMFITEVLTRQLVPHPLIVVRRPRVLFKTQRREFVRLELSLPVTVRQLPQGPLSQPEGEEVKTYTVDISGGGARIIYPYELPAGTWLELAIHLPEEVKCRGQVRRIEHIETGANKKRRLAVEFAEISQASQEKIIAFIFKRQRELRRHGLL